MARKLEVEIVGDSASLERAFSRSSASAKKFDTNLGHAVRGATAGSGVFQHLGRSLAFASGGFLAFAGVTDFLKASIDAGREAAVAQQQLATQLKVSGARFGQWRDTIDKADLSLSHLSGFTSTELESSLATLDRSTGNINAALKLNAVAADVARGRHISLATAAIALGKAYGGQETALKRLGIVIPAGVKGLAAINFVAAKFAGQARAGTTESQRFSATLHDTQIIIGQALLPTLNKYLRELGDWLDRMNRSGKLQRDVNAIVKDATGLISGFRAAVAPLVGIFKALGDAVGGTKNELKLLAEIMVAFKVSKLVSGLGLIGSTARTSAGEVDALRLSLGKLSVVGLAIADFELGKKALTTQATAGFVGGGLGSPFQKGSEDNSLFQAGRSGKTGILSLPGGGTIDLAHLNAANRGAYAAGLEAFLKAQGANIAKSFGGIGGTGSGRFAGLGASRTTGSVALPGSVSGTGRSAGLSLPSSISGTGASSRWASLGLSPYSGSFQGLAAHFTAPIAIELAQARADALGQTAEIAALAQRVKKVAIRALQSGRLSIQAQIDAWNVIGQINQAAQQNGFGPTGRVVTAAALTRGIHFADATARRAQEARIAQALAHGGHVPTGKTLQGQPVVLHTTIQLNDQVLARAVTTHQQKQGRYRSTQTSGINAGRGNP